MKWPYFLFMLGGILGITAGIAVNNPHRFIGLGDWLWLWCVLAAAGFGLLSFACVRLAIGTRGIRRWLLASCAGFTALVGLACIAWGGLSSLLVDYSNEQRVAATSPDGRFEVILYYADRRAAHLRDRPDGLYLQTTEGFLSKRTYLGCLSDSGHDRLDWVRFADANTVVVRQVGQEGVTERSVSFDPVKVRVIRPMGDSCPPDLYTG
ncbi:hypothetical protein F8568_045240 [Actinomadura sp. LD22]|uniref:Uncharacterized protein n=1 Tax=Actinomadura physcomitrii TaxID=2650748 RepID=A0A6I4MNW1_9ACTN|nr:hypothetical protein [Actinomadura physcomitrii]MWA07413.1 hypothetical protein [Actinomadura physcomitrii]